MQTTGPAPIVASGWRDAGIFVWAIAALTVLYAIGLEHGAHPVPIVLIAMLLTSTILIASGGGPGPDAWRIMTAPQSLLVGASTIGLEIFYVLSMQHVSPAEAALLMRIAIPLSLVVGWLLLGRRPGPLAAIGGLILLAGIFRLVEGVTPEHRWLAMLYSSASAVCFVSRSLSSELHPWNRNARSVRERLKVTGLVVLTTTLLFYAVAGSLMGLRAAGIIPATPMLPRPDQFLHVPTVLVALAVGGFVLTSMYFLSFSAVVKIRTENFIAVTVLSPVATLILQVIAGWLGIIERRSIEPHVLACMAVIVTAAMMIVAQSRLQSPKRS